MLEMPVLLGEQMSNPPTPLPGTLPGCSPGPRISAGAGDACLGGCRGLGKVTCWFGDAPACSRSLWVHRELGAAQEEVPAVLKILDNFVRGTARELNTS